MQPPRKVRPGSTIQCRYATYGADGASITQSGLAVTDIEVFKGSSVTQRASDNGYTLIDTDGTDIDGITGFQGFSIDLADNSDAGFWAAGQEYWVVVATVDVDGKTIMVLVDHFVIGYEGSLLDTTIATLTNQNSFTLTDGPAENDALNGCWAIVHDVASKIQTTNRIILDYTGSTKTVTALNGATFTIAAGDNISIMGPMPLQQGNACFNASSWGIFRSVVGAIEADTVAISGDTAAADNLEAILDGTGGTARFLTSTGTAALRIGTTSSNGAAMEITASNGTRSTALQFGRILAGSGAEAILLTAQQGSYLARADIVYADDSSEWAYGCEFSATNGIDSVYAETAYLLDDGFDYRYGQYYLSIFGAAFNELYVASFKGGVDRGSIYAPDTVVASNAGNNVNLGADAITASVIAANAIGSSEAPLLANLDAAVSSRLPAASYTAPDNAGISAAAASAASADTKATTILARLGAWTGSAANTLLGAMRAMFRKDTDAAVPSDINADLGSGAGAANNTTDSLEAIRDRGDAAWTTASTAGLALESTAQSIKAKTDNLPADTATVLAAMPNAVLELSEGVDGLNLKKFMRLEGSAMAGRLSGAGTGTERFRDLNNTKDRIVSTVDDDGNRSDVTLDLD